MRYNLIIHIKLQSICNKIVNYTMNYWTIEISNVDIIKITNQQIIIFYKIERWLNGSIILIVITYIGYFMIKY